MQEQTIEPIEEKRTEAEKRGTIKTEEPIIKRTKNNTILSILSNNINLRLNF